MILLLTWMLCFISTFIYSQENPPIKKNFPKLTAEKMYDDFDFFIETVEDFSPQIQVRKAVTGIDPLIEIKEMRSEISEMKSTEDFANLMLKAITILQDGHSSMLWPSGYPNDYLMELGVSNDAIELFPHYYELRKEDGIKKKFNLKLKYINGYYYNIERISYRDKIIDSGWKLTKVNGKKAQNFISKLYPYLPRMRWDYLNERYYSEYFYNAINIKSEEVLKLEFVNDSGKRIKAKFNLNEAIQYKEDAENAEESPPKVNYFANEQVLYIRVPRMSLDYNEFYPEEIRSKALGKPLKKVIIDIRDNPGGADNVWVNILKAIIDKPINFELLLLSNPTKELKAHYPDDFDNWESYHVPFLDNHEYKIFASGSREIEPTDNSLNFDGKIYILQNDGIYSSAGAFSAIGLLADNIITLGQNTGWLLGRGVNPMVFELPHSKILYRIEPVIDFQNVKNARDVYHDNVEIPVSLTIKQYLNRLEYNGDVYGKDFLFNEDTVFSGALND